MPMSRIEKRTFSLPAELVEHWLRNEVAPTYDEMRANPASAIRIDDVIESIRARHAACLKDDK